MPLLPHQEGPAEQLRRVLSVHNCSLDASDTGTGKTYVAVHLAKDLELKPLVVCPKSVISTWKRVLDENDVSYLAVLNPEKLKTGRTPWLTKVNKKNFHWNLPEETNVLLIFDEAHMFGAPDSQNAIVMATAKSTGCKVHLMSATLAETPLRLRAPGYLLGLHQFRNFYDWAARHGCFRNPWNGMEFSKGKAGQEAIHKIHSELFPERGVRVAVKDLPDFPEALIQPDSYDSDHISEIREAYEAMDEELAQPEGDNPLTILLRARQKTEMFKVPLVFDLAMEQLEEGHSAVIFTNFRDPFAKLEEYFRERGVTVSRILGGQSQEEREENMNAFQENRNLVCLAMIQAGGQAISLHDINNRPRVSFIMPPISARELKQALGRIHRAGALSPAVQKIVFAADTVEEDIAKMIRRKLTNLDLLNDGDMTGGIL